MITVYEALTLMITFGSLIVAVITIIISLDKRK